MNKLLCIIFGHKHRFNFPSVPDKCICYRCHTKWKLEGSTLSWYKVDGFSKELGTDEQMKNRWHK